MWNNIIITHEDLLPTKICLAPPKLTKFINAHLMGDTHAPAIIADQMILRFLLLSMLEELSVKHLSEVPIPKIMESFQEFRQLSQNTQLLKTRWVHVCLEGKIHNTHQHPTWLISLRTKSIPLEVTNLDSVNQCMHVRARARTVPPFIDLSELEGQVYSSGPDWSVVERNLENV